MKFLEWLIAGIILVVGMAIGMVVTVFLTGIEVVTVYFAWQWFVAGQSGLPVIPFWTVFGIVFIYRRLTRVYKDSDSLTTKESWTMFLTKLAVFGEIWLIKIIFL